VERTGDEEEYKNEAWADSRLTELGESQASSLRPSLEGVPIEVVLVSPLSRAIKTGLLAVPPGPKFVIQDAIRERIGTHPCDRRRTRAELAADFPSVDSADLSSEADDKWSAAREPWAGVVARAEGFCSTLRLRPERDLAVVTHNDFLQALLLMSRDVRIADERLRIKFRNAQHLPVILTWTETPVAALVASPGSGGGAVPAGVLSPQGPAGPVTGSDSTAVEAFEKRGSFFKA